ncbi:zinc-dependent alcohol dehydrogenase family protein [Streptomyces samsunensis]|uniref:zinc-dependent alcohol dehydrogenase family protein n=1 Tax=Streptomyces malaysiensis TaxID=92644 RepID=UPI001583F55A|nr:zinc-dependent alcohol dehydrogenase family protein [Streptomyces samsunensis]NUH40147.1 zinc-dependent alcohol dehydrogenase family protein [Streptomyces samsunensis]
MYDRLGEGEDSELGLVIRDLDVPEPGPGEVRLRVSAYGLNQADILLMSNRHYAISDLPMRLGYEASGVVEAVGPGVTRFGVGDRVSTIPNIDGPYSCANEYALAREEFTTPWPEGWSAAEAAGFWMQYLTAYYPMKEIFPVAEGDWVLITAASGGTGLGAIRIGKALGARVIATTRTSEKCAFLREQGADATIATAEEDMTAAIMSITGGEGVRLVSDGVGGGFVAQYVDALAFDGIAYVHGGLSGTNEVSFPILPLVRRRAGLYGYSLINETRDPEALRRGIGFVTELINSEALGRPVIDRVYPLCEASAAYERMKAGLQRGKIIIAV